MKKSVLMILLAGFISANAQNRTATNVALYGPATHYSALKVGEPNLRRSSLTIPAVNAPVRHQAAKRNGTGSGNHTQTLCEVPIGSAGNQFGSAFGAKTNLCYNRDLNTLTFIHRANPTNNFSTIGFITYDYSTNGGTSWTTNQEFVYRDTTWDSVAYQNERGRYPQGGIYNPVGNSDPANSYMTGYGPVTYDGTTINAGWPWHYEGTTQLGSSTNNQQLFNADQSTGGLGAIIPQGGTIVKNTGETWWSCEGYDGAAYDDTILLSHGVYNGAGDFTYTFKKIPVPVCTDIDGGKMYQNCAVIFNDAGNIGYVVVLGNDWVCDMEPQDSSMGIIVLKTTDSGNSWTKIHSPDVNLLDPLLLNSGNTYQSSSELDLGMDANDHLHICMPVIPFSPGNTIYLGYIYGAVGLFDISTSNDLNWEACLIAKPETYFGQFGTPGNTTTDPEIDEDNRLQFSRSWDGSKVFYTWFDTDTNIFGPGLNNFPDAKCIGRDMDGNLWTAEADLTEFSGTSADGAALFANVSYYTINDGTNENVPIVINTMASQPTGTAVPVNFFYEGCAAISNYVNTGNCMDITGTLGIKETAASTAFSVSSNYPNPFSNKTNIVVTLPKAGNVTVEISNSLGQLLSTALYQHLKAGVNPITIDGSSLSKGLYFYTVKSGNESTTKTMSVE